MYRKFTFVLALSVSLGMMASINTPEAQWGKLFGGTTSSGNQNTAVELDEEGNLYSLYTAGSTEAAPSIYFGDEELFKGYPYNTGNSNNANMTLLKTNPQGDVIWSVYSTVGDFAANQGTVAPTPDGGCVVMMKVRHSDQAPDKKITFTDGKGAVSRIDWTCAKRYNRPIVMKISKDGGIQWIKLPDMSTEPAPKASGNYADYTSDAVNVYKGCVDKDGNIYVPLNYRSTITFDKADGTAKFQARNVTTWTGDPQTVCGDFLVAKFDADGNFLKALQLGGTAYAAYAQRVACVNTQLVIYGYATGNGSALSVGGHALTPTTYPSPLLFYTDRDFNITWAECLQGGAVQNKNAVQNVGVTVTDKYIWLCGQFNGKFGDGTHEVASTQGTLREGFIIKLRLTDGEWLNQRVSRQDEFTPAAAKTGLTGYFQVLANPNNEEKIWVFGYVMNATVGVFLRQYNADTLEADLSNAWSLVKGGGAPTCQSIAYDAPKGICYLTARGNKAFEPMGGETSAAPTGWGIYLAKFSLPQDLVSAVERIAPDQARLNIYPSSGGLRILNNGGETSVDVYDVSGRRIVSAFAPQGSSYISIAPGIYIANGRKILISK